MTITLSPTLTTEMGSLSRNHASKATAERWLPEWTPKISGLSALQYEQYAHGHTACVAPNGNGAGEDVLFRARSGSWASPFDGVLYFSVLSGSELDDPTTWENAGAWTSSGQGGLMRPAWYNNVESNPASNGGSIAAVWSGSFFRCFFTHTNGSLYYIDVNTSGVLITGTTLVAAFSTDSFSLSSMQIASCSYAEVFILRTELVEASQAAWHKPVYGSIIHHFYQSGGTWYDGPVYPFNNQSEAALVRNSQFEYGAGGQEWGAISSHEVVAQWGKRPCGGLAANELSGNRVVVSAGFTFWKRYGYNTHNQGILTFIYHRSSSLWERGVEADLSDYVTERLDYALFARGSNVEGNNILVWNRNVEPSDYDQLEAAMSLPRVREVVYARFDATGKALTQYQYLGDQNDLTAAAIVAVNHAGGKWLYALGWHSVFQSPPAAFLCSVPAPEDLELYCDGWKTSVNNRYGMSVDLNVEDAGVLFQEDSPLQPGRLVKVYAGTPTEQVQIGQGLLDLVTPSFSLEGETHRAKATARAEKGLLDPRSAELTEVLPQNTIHIAPTDPIVHIANHKGYWETVKLEWPNKFFSGTYGSLNGRLAYRLRSFPYAYTGGDQGYGYPGQVLDQRPMHKGTWWNDAAWTDMTPMVDGSIEATVRFGDVVNGADFSFYDRNKNQVFAPVTRNNGVITVINWRTGGYGGPIFNTVRQNALMAGLICHAAEMNKKYSFVWESSTASNAVYGGVDKVPADWLGYAKPFSASSHTDDTWRAETMDRCDFRGYALGPNKLYLVLSDYDDTDSGWQSGGKWIHKVVAGGIDAVGLLPGSPADLKMQVWGGTIFCFYRMHQVDGQPPAQWQFAFSYKAGRFGAGRFGIIGRGHAGIQWDAFYYPYAQANPLPTGRSKIPNYDNYVDFWDIKVSDCVMDRPMEEVLRRRCWQGFTPTTFASLVNEPNAQAVNAGTVKKYTPPVENLTIDFKITLSAMGGEAGIVCRAVDPINITAKQHVRLGLVVNGGLPAATGAVTSYAVKRVYDANGAEVAAQREYSPAPLYLHNTWPVPVRMTIRGNVYSVWVAGNYIGHFVDDTPGGVYFGLYATGANAIFRDVYVPELYEVLENSTLEVNQTVFDAIKSMIGKRALKGVFQPTGALRLSYFETHDTGPTFQDSLIQSAVRLSDRFFSIVRVDGAYTWAVYASEVLLKLGRRFMQASFPDIFHREFAYKEARNLCIKAAEEQVQATFVGLPDYRVQPEDKVEIFVEQQNIAGHYLVDDVSHTFQMDQDDPQADSEISTRRSVTI